MHNCVDMSTNMCNHQKRKKEGKKERKPMKHTTRSLLREIDQAHDWEQGQPRAGNGTQLSQTDTCMVCSLRRHWFSDTQNRISESVRFSDGENNKDLSLRQAIARGCAQPKEDA